MAGKDQGPMCSSSGRMLAPRDLTTPNCKRSLVQAIGNWFCLFDTDVAWGELMKSRTHGQRFTNGSCSSTAAAPQHGKTPVTCLQQTRPCSILQPRHMQQWPISKRIGATRPCQNEFGIAPNICMTAAAHCSAHCWSPQRFQPVFGSKS